LHHADTPLSELAGKDPTLELFVFSSISSGAIKKSFPSLFGDCPEVISVIRRKMDFQSVRKKTDFQYIGKKTDWKSILRFEKTASYFGTIT